MRRVKDRQHLFPRPESDRGPAPTVPDNFVLRDVLGPGPWDGRCHEASLKVVQALRARGIPAKVARGWARGVRSQHSWCVLGPDPYDRDAAILDPTLVLYDPSCQVDTGGGAWLGSYRDRRHEPHGGFKIIWAVGRPPPATKPAIKLRPAFTLSEATAAFLDEALGPLDRAGWSVLTRLPVLGWPSGEVYAAMVDTLELEALVPIDRLGMLTDRYINLY